MLGREKVPNKYLSLLSSSQKSASSDAKPTQPQAG